MIKKIKPFCKSIILLIFSIFLTGGSILVLLSPWKQSYEPPVESMMILIFGNGFDTSFDADVNVEFNDLGKIDLTFNLPSGEHESQNAWVFIWEPTIPYTWSIDGKVENRKIEDIEFGTSEKRDWTSTKTGLTSGKNDDIVSFYVSVDDDKKQEKITIQIDNEYTTCYCQDILKVVTPTIGTLSLRYNDDDAVYWMNHIDELVEKANIDLNKEGDLVEHIFSVGKIDGVALSGIFSTIKGRYTSEKYYNDPKYQLRKKEPEYGEEKAQYIMWDKEIFYFFPTIEYKEEKPNTFIQFLITIGGSLILTACGNIYSTAKNLSANKSIYSDY